MPYLLGGSLAAAVWGEPRSTLDVDFVISLELKRITALSKELEKRAVLIPADIMLSQLEESRGDLAIVGYHLSAGFKAEPVGGLDGARLVEPVGMLNIRFGYGLGKGTSIAPAWLNLAA